MLRLDPSSDMAWEALRALYIIGKPEDEAAIVPFVHGVAGMPANVATQASATLQAIRSRQYQPAITSGRIQDFASIGVQILRFVGN